VKRRVFFDDAFTIRKKGESRERLSESVPMSRERKKVYIHVFSQSKHPSFCVFFKPQH
jgi:hypothetical protein